MGNKRLLKLSQVNEVVVPCYDELSVKVWYPKMITRPELHPYFPEKYAVGRQCEREYFWNLCHTMFPQEVSALIHNAGVQRFSVGQEENEADRIHMTEEWAALLEQFPCKPARKGKMIHLLKLKSKKQEGARREGPTSPSTSSARSTRRSQLQAPSACLPPCHLLKLQVVGVTSRKAPRSRRSSRGK